MTLTDVLQTFTATLAEAGNELTLTLRARTDGGSEAFVFRNIVIEGAPSTELVAADLGTGGTSLNLTSFNNPFDGAFGSAGDGFQVYQRFVSPSIPFALLDDSETIFTADTLGIIEESDTEPFFGVVDTVNGDNPGGAVSASWVFDVSGFTDLSLAIDIAAMGDFESSDTFSFSVAVDGGPETESL